MIRVMNILVIVPEHWNWAAVQFNQLVISGHNDGPKHAAVTERTPSRREWHSQLLSQSWYYIAYAYHGVSLTRNVCKQLTCNLFAEHKHMCVLLNSKSSYYEREDFSQTFLKLIF